MIMRVVFYAQIHTVHTLSLVSECSAPFCDVMSKFVTLRCVVEGLTFERVYWTV